LRFEKLKDSLGFNPEFFKAMNNNLVERLSTEGVPLTFHELMKRSKSDMGTAIINRVTRTNFLSRG